VQKCAKEFVGNKKKLGWAVPPKALRRNGPECDAAFDYSIFEVLRLEYLKV